MDFDRSRAALERDTHVEFYCAGGPGGQHRNKTETAVRLTHRPSGVRAIATEQRSRAQNLEQAFARLHAKLEAKSRVRKPRRPTRPTKGSKERRHAAKQAAGARKKQRAKVTLE